MKDKIVLITGATSGIGFQTALALAKMGAQVVITGRSQKTAQEAVANIQTMSGNSRVGYLLADLTQQAEIRALAEAFKQKYLHLDVLINNAGLAASQRQITADGVEAMFAVNVVAPFLLTRLLMDVLQAAPAARVVTLTGGDLPAHVAPDNLQAERSFEGLKSYSQSKVAMMAMMYEYAERTKDSTVTLNVCYPGQASTNMTRNVTADMLPGFMRFLFPLFKLVVRDDRGKSAAKASRSSVYLASSPETKGMSGKYFDTNSKLATWPAVVSNAEFRAKLWSNLERLTTKA